MELRMHDRERVARVERARSGDPESVRALWQENRRWVAAVLLAHKDGSSELDDLLQEVALRMVRGIYELESTETFGPWLRAIALNVARADGRKKSNRKRLMRLAPSGERGTVVDPGRATEDGLLEELEALPEHYREALLLRCVRGMSYKAIGAVTGLPETTIESRIARARRMLRERVVSGAAEGSNDG